MKCESDIPFAVNSLSAVRQAMNAFTKPATFSGSSTFDASDDKRKYRRVVVSLQGRFMRSNQEEYTCKSIDISAGGIAIQTPREVEIGERVICYFPELGRLEGNVIRYVNHGFAMTFDCTERKRERLVGQLMWLANRHELNMPDERRHDRIQPRNPYTKMKLGGEFLVECRLIDISVSGASVELEARPPIGDHVVLGKLRAKVVRHHSQGIGIEFDDVQNADALERYFS